MEVTMRAHQIMTRPVITVTPDTTIVEAAKIMLKHHISGLPVVDATGKLTGIVSDDFIRRSEIGTQRRPGRWLDFIFRPAIMRRGRPYRGENSGPGKDIVGKLDTQTPNWAGLVMSVVRRRPEVGGRRSNQNF
jgi:hypothetical protein